MCDLPAEIQRLRYEALRAPESDYRSGYLDSLYLLLEILEEADHIGGEWRD